jgi:hypothetical protein
MDEDYNTIREINNTKGMDYAGEEDALANFKTAAEALALTPEEIWSVLAYKHWSAVMTYVREGGVASEPIEGRLHDLILYCFLMLGLVREKQEAPPPQRPTIHDKIAAIAGET